MNTHCTGQRRSCLLHHVFQFQLQLLLTGPVEHGGIQDRHLPHTTAALAVVGARALQQLRCTADFRAHAASLPQTVSCCGCRCCRRRRRRRCCCCCCCCCGGWATHARTVCVFVRSLVLSGDRMDCLRLRLRLRVPAHVHVRTLHVWVGGRSSAPW